MWLVMLPLSNKYCISSKETLHEINTTLECITDTYSVVSLQQIMYTN